MRTWMAAASIALTAAATPAMAEQQCDPQALVSACAAGPAANASFIDLMSEGTQPADESPDLFVPDRAPDAVADAPEAVSRPAVYVGREAGVPLAAAGSGLAALNSSASGLSAGAVPAWLGLSTLGAQPAPSVAWVLALGFLGIIVLRRTRASLGY